ncbi:MAG: hypothetical protein QG656_2742 [Candidatus Hydrogenedentes bacterium]|nr:hypothetical protein [Candidatus Hydrogenedentota bacterium]
MYKGMQSFRTRGWRDTQGSCLIGCLIAAGVFLLLIVIAAVAGYFLLQGTIEAFTDTKPLPLETYEPDPARVAELQKQWKAFSEDPPAGETVKPMTLTAKDINDVIQNNPDFRGKLQVEIEGDQATGKISYPLDLTQLPMLGGRYLHGSATFSVLLQNGIFCIFIQSIEVNGQAIPDMVMSEIRKQNLLQGLEENRPDMLRHLGGIEVKDGVILITPKTQGDIVPATASPSGT